MRPGEWDLESVLGSRDEDETAQVTVSALKRPAYVQMTVDAEECLCHGWESWGSPHWTLAV